MPGIPALGKVRQENCCKFKPSLSYMKHPPPPAPPHLKKPKEKEEMNPLVHNLQAC